MPLRHRISIVTGATAGIGEEIARRFVHAGAQVVLNGRRREKLDELIREFGSEDATGVAGDAADPATIARLFQAARGEFAQGKRDADLVVINAGRGLKGSVLDSDEAQWEEMYRTNVLGAARLLRSAAQRMLADLEESKRRGEASESWLQRPHDIVVVGSTVGRNLSPFSSMYGSTKFALHSFTEAARRELGPKGIRVSLIEPGFVESEFQGVAGYDPAWFAQVKDRIGPVLKPADVAQLVMSIITLPAHVHLSDAMIRPTRQDYP
ncbi:MAG: SDR family oxidoreductase [Planctomycetota bacterium]|nr:SDR family oxidoreductase [Planctomycetota bacterium]